MSDDRTLLERHNPVLVIFPQEAGKRRPGAGKPGGRGWGDYHPANAEFFLDNVVHRPAPRRYDFRRLVGQVLRRPMASEDAVGLDAFKAMLSATNPDATRTWEIDLATVPSQDDEGAWRAYLRMLRDGETAPRKAYRKVAYGRVVRDLPGGRMALQYWYFYCYNDFVNNHEADWEMATIELDADETPIAMGISSHHGGARRAWDAVLKETQDGQRPLLFVSKGSHAGRFGFRKGGYPAAAIQFHSGLPWGLRHAADWTRRAVVVPLTHSRLLTDVPPADPVAPGDAATVFVGVRESPPVEVLDDPATVTPTSRHWWLRYQGLWGSQHSRVRGTIGVMGPWAADPAGKDLRWHHPLKWLPGLAVDDVQ